MNSASNSNTLHVVDMAFKEIREEKAKKTIYNVAFLAFLIIFISFVFYILKENVPNFQATSLGIFQKALAEEPQMGHPVKLSIPRLKVDATVEQVTVDSEMNMNPPKDLGNVGWYNTGSMPGEPGTVTMDGHFEPSNSKKSAAFDKLYTLHKGDQIVVTDENGNMVNYLVKETRKFNPETDADVLYDSHDRKSHLNLITTEGTWNQMTQSYSNRIVVFADKDTK